MDCCLLGTKPNTWTKDDVAAILYHHFTTWNITNYLSVGLSGATYWNLNQNSKLFKEDAFENVVYKVSAILFVPHVLIGIHSDPWERQDILYCQEYFTSSSTFYDALASCAIRASGDIAMPMLEILINVVKIYPLTVYALIPCDSLQCLSPMVPAHMVISNVKWVASVSRTPWCVTTTRTVGRGTALTARSARPGTHTYSTMTQVRRGIILMA